MWFKGCGAGQDAEKSRAWGEVIKGLGHLTALKTLDLEGMRGVESRAPLDGALTRLNKTLKGLEIRDTDWLYPLPNTTGKLTGLLALRISNNPRAVALPVGVFGRLTALGDLRAHRNGQLTSIPSLVKNTALRTLILHGNNLTAIPSLEWTRSTKLETLILQNNRLTQIPVGVQQLTKLKDLDMSGNAIASLDNLGLRRPASNDTKVWLGGNPVCANNATAGVHQLSGMGVSLVKWVVSCQSFCSKPSLEGRC
jgi:Leucine-rich repeat (LRR) protein